MEGHLLNISQPMAVAAKVLIPCGGSCGSKFWFHWQDKCCLTVMAGRWCRTQSCWDALGKKKWEMWWPCKDRLSGDHECGKMGTPWT